MQYNELGSTGINISRICFGSLVMGPLQADLDLAEGAKLIAAAMDRGINFIDTAELYGTYEYIKKAIELTGKKPVISSKSYAFDEEGAKKSLFDALTKMGIGYIDIFLMHEQESRLTLKGHQKALEYYIKAKKEGLIKAVGVSTHNIEVVEACAGMPDIDVIHPLVNINGTGIGDGSIDKMLSAVKKAYDNQKGIFSMKPLGGGGLINDYYKAVDFIINIPYIHSIAVGMQSINELDMNIRAFLGKKVPPKIEKSVTMQKRHLHIDYWCTGCGMCVKRCRQNALCIKGNRVSVNEDKCVFCGYCIKECPQFAIKIF